MTEVIAAVIGAFLGFCGSSALMDKQLEAMKNKDLDDKKSEKNKSINYFCILFNDGYRLLLSMRNVGHWGYETKTYNEKLKFFCKIHKDKDIAHALDYEILIKMENLSVEIEDKFLPLLNEDNDTAEILKYIDGTTIKKCEYIEKKLIEIYGEDIPAVKFIFNTSYEYTIF